MELHGDRGVAGICAAHLGFFFTLKGGAFEWEKAETVGKGASTHSSNGQHKMLPDAWYTHTHKNGSCECLVANATVLVISQLTRNKQLGQIV